MMRDIDNRLHAIASALPILVQKLRADDYVFDRPDEVLPGVDPDVEHHIRRIEQEIGPIPYSVAQFWRIIGSIDLRGSHPSWKGCDFPDPLVIFPISAAVEELQDFLDDREYRMNCHFPYVIPISPDDYHKEGDSGGMWYNVSCPAVADDPPLNAERHQTTFTAYLEISLRWGGFPGLDGCAAHNWPIQRLIRGLAT